MLAVAGASSNIVMDGLVLDGGGVGAGVLLDVLGGASVPADQVIIRNCTFQNLTPTPQGGWDGAIYNPVGMTNSSITHNRFLNMGTGLFIASPNNLVISNNYFDGITASDAIFIPIYAVSFPYGKGIQISGNRGRRIKRMAIELWGGGGSGVESAVISENTFTDWDPQPLPDSFGISVVVGENAQIRDNLLLGGTGPWGIELGSPGSTVEGNVISGFTVGLAVGAGANAVISGNSLLNQESAGILFTNAGGSLAGINVQSNYILNPKDIGIYVNTGLWGNAVITGNTITRTVGSWAGDSRSGFTGISTTPPVAPVTVSGNFIIQDNPNPFPNFQLYGIRLNAYNGSDSGSTYTDNILESKANLPFGIGLYLNAPGALNGVSVVGNRFEHLQSVTGGASPSQAVAVSNTIVP
jgi:hypothetical protein